MLLNLPRLKKLSQSLLLIIALAFSSVVHVVVLSEQVFAEDPSPAPSPSPDANNPLYNAFCQLYWFLLYGIGKPFAAGAMALLAFLMLIGKINFTTFMLSVTGILLMFLGATVAGYIASFSGSGTSVICTDVNGNGNNSGGGS